MNNFKNYNSSLTQKILQQADIVDVVKRYLSNIQKKGGNYIVMCPFHHDNNPSMIINTKKGIYKCFACPKVSDKTRDNSGGNAIKFVKNYLNITYQQALIEVAKIIGYDLKGMDIKENVYSKEQLLLFKINQIAKNIFLDELEIALQRKNNNQTIIKFVNLIGYAQIQKFQVGYANKDFLIKFLKDAELVGLNETNLLDSKVIISKDNKFYSFFYNRIIFPIFNENHKIIGFNGRSLSSDESAKYINNTETSVFKKNNILYNVNHLNINNTKDNVYVLEGIKDVIAMDYIGYSNSVATLGSLLTEVQLKILLKYTNNIIFVPDQDAAGVIGTLNNAMLALKNKCNVRIVKKLSQKDVADVLVSVKDKQLVRDQVIEQLDYFEFLMYYFGKDLNPSDYQSVINYINSVLDKLVIFPTTDIALNAYLQEISNQTNINASVINKTFVEKHIAYEAQQERMRKNYYKDKDPVITKSSKNYYIKFNSNNLLHLLILQILYSKQAVLMIENLQETIKFSHYEENKTAYHLLNEIKTFYSRSEIINFQCGSILKDKNALVVLENYLENLKKYPKEKKSNLLELLDSIANHNYKKNPYLCFNKNFTKDILERIFAFISKNELLNFEDEFKLIVQQDESFESTKQKNLITRKIKKIRNNLNKTSLRNFI